ncbi:MAG: histidine phosphatase family protein [Alphaproteobacteria bacterium]|jgi:alpha-ribazole phosphatase
MSDDTTRWWLVRHAPTVNPGRTVYGALDLDIHPPDPDAIAALAAMLPDDPAWLVTHLSRTRATLDALLAARGIDGAAPEILVEPEFGEQNFGDWEGRPSAEVWDEIRAADMKWPDDIRPPGGESFSDVAARVSAAAHGWSDRLRGRDVVAVIHSGSVRGFLSTAMGGAPEAALAYVVDTLSVTRVDHIDGRGWRVGYVNRVALAP